jgi:hypothetical protein
VKDKHHLIRTAVKAVAETEFKSNAQPVHFRIVIHGTVDKGKCSMSSNSTWHTQNKGTEQ